MLHLPDVAELVRDQVVRPVVRLAAQEDGDVGGVAVEAAPGRQAKEPRRGHERDALDAHRAGVPAERVEAALGVDQRGVRHRPTVVEENSGGGRRLAAAGPLGSITCVREAT